MNGRSSPSRRPTGGVGRIAARTAASLLLAVAAVGPGPGDLAGQEAAGPDRARLVGQVVSAATGEPLPGAVVSLTRSRVGGVSDSTGNFRIPDAVAGQDTAEVRYIGYETSSVPLYLEGGRTTRAVLLLSPNVVRVADLKVEVERPDVGLLSGFERRRKKGIGHFITYAEIRERGPRYTSDMLRTVPGLRVGPIRNGRAPVTLGRSGGHCSPALFVDGIYYAGMEVDDVTAPDLGAIEVYTGAGQIPPRFALQAGGGCGAIVIWTRRGDMRGESE